VEILLGVIAVFVVIVILGKIKGAPAPKNMTDEQILTRMASETKWIEKYQRLPFENQQGEGIKKQYKGKLIYIYELFLELKKRHEHVDEKTLGPVFKLVLPLAKNEFYADKAVQADSNYLDSKKDNGY